MYQLPKNRKTLRKDPPEYLETNRSSRDKVLTEDELNKKTLDFFDDMEKRVVLYNKMGVDFSWVTEWTKKWWGSWLDRDMDLCRTLCAPDIVYKDPVSFGLKLKGMDEFIDYNFAFFDAIPDWRYDPIDVGYLDYVPGRGVRLVVHYVGTGHWDGPLRLYPFDENALSIPGTGQFIQCAAIDRYHFTEEGIMYEGETLWDVAELLQMTGLIPKADSWQFGALLDAAKLSQTLKKVGGLLDNLG